MLPWIRQSIYVHAAFGFTALVAGAAALATAKGGSIHRRAGLAFVVSLLIAVAIAQPAIILRRNVFLACLTPFVVSMAIRGYRSAKAHHLGAISALWIDHVAVGAAGAGGIALVIAGVRMFKKGASIYSFAGVFVGLGYFAVKHAWREWSSITGSVASNRRELLLAHVVGMLGAYTAAVTAFVAVNFHTEVFSPVLVWLSPPFLGGLLVKWWRRRLASPETLPNTFDRNDQASYLDVSVKET